MKRQFQEKIPYKKAIELKDRRIAVSAVRTINLGNFESIKVSADFSGSIADDVPESDAYDKAFDIVTGEVNRYLESIGIKS